VKKQTSIFVISFLLASPVLPVLAESQPKISCDFTILFARSDHGVEIPYHKVVVRGSLDDSFHFDGCSTQYHHGQYCVSHYGVSLGARLLKNQNGEIVSEGNCCNNVQNKVISVSKDCNFLPAVFTDLDSENSDQTDCWAVYSDGDLNIPCLKVTSPFGGELKYEVNMQYKPLSEPTSFELTDAQQQ
jgi:hypothetical protein